MGQHRGGYSAFTFEITDVVKFGEENQIHVKVDNSKTDDVLPLGGDFNIYGGIYRPVQLIITEQACITPLDFASPGVYLSQKKVSKEKAVIEVVAKISNGLETAAYLELVVEISDTEGNLVQTGQNMFSIKAKQTSHTLIPITIDNPHLWNAVKDPYLYSAKIILNNNGNVIDEIIQPLGLRYYETDAEKGFFLNGEHEKIKGGKPS